jgi:hypothetical protein
MTLTAVDELQHPASAGWLWRESLYFSFHDAAGQIGGMTTIGTRTNQGRMEGLAAILRAGQPALLYTASHPLEAGAVSLCAIEGIGYELQIPLQQWRVRADANFTFLNSQAGEGTVPASFDLIFDALSPAYEFPARLGQVTGQARHYEQNGRIAGQVSIGDQRFEIAGFGCRDHSWGIRDLSRAGQVVVLFAQFGPHLTVNAVWGQGPNETIQVGFLSRHGTNVALDRVHVAVHRDPVSHLPQAVRAEIGSVDGQRLDLQATPISVLPIRLNQGQMQLHWYECFTHFQLGREVGYGILEVTRLARQEPTTQT